ncbi:glucose-6-phosphate isomerase [Prochlorococcus marinus]|uniref:glucose-6-phosphate isomerase n=1 Tax=Prochlorococcus marinus TaxID=1219 RepID=UPI0022B3B8E1|nr:glucose-6-phosphate isomerase [Prochlorococcus marinus]
MAITNIFQMNNNDKWIRYCDLLFSDDSLGFWLDISRMDVEKSDFEKFKDIYSNAFDSVESLENGSIANIDEGRQVGHYWLRNPKIAPTQEISDSITKEIQDISKFGASILNGEITNSVGKKYTDVFWIGIGGSGLGPLLIKESFKRESIGLNLHFLDNVDPEGISHKLNSILPTIETTLFVVVSKSGGTPEPLIGMEQAMKFVQDNNQNWSSRAIAITSKGSKLDVLAANENWLDIFDLPDWVGGRTSITGAVGLLPAALIGADINKFLDGASQMDVLTREKDIKNNPAALLSLAWYKSGKGKGLRDMVVLPYRDRLEVFSRYLQQLVMESLGKKLDRDGNQVNQGIAVYGNKGSTDQHAYVQQLRDGVDNFFVNFIEILHDPSEIVEVKNKRPGDYLSGFLQGTRSALTEGGRQNLTITFKSFDESSLGALIALFERAVSLYAELINVNSYNQPGVEAGKKAATNIINLQKEIEELLEDGKERTLSQINDALSTDSTESIYLILRKLSENSERYSMNGNQSNPDQLIITKN